MLDLVTSRRLMRVLEAWCLPFPGFCLYHPSRRQAPAALRALVAILQSQPFRPASRPFARCLDPSLSVDRTVAALNGKA